MHNTLDMMYMDDIDRENHFDYMLDCLTDEYDNGLRKVDGERLLKIYHIETPLSSKEFDILNRLVGRLPGLVIQFKKDPRKS